MSGPICPDCSGLEVGAVGSSQRAKKHYCPLCGWKGSPLPNKSVPSEGLQFLGENYREKKRLREKGELFFLRIYLIGTEEEMDQVTDEVMELFELESLEGERGDPPYLLIELSNKLSHSHRKKMNSLPGVKKLKLF